jgi:hypothetical protein
VLRKDVLCNNLHRSNALEGLINFALWYDNKYIIIKYNIEYNGSSPKLGDDPINGGPGFVRANFKSHFFFDSEFFSNL